MNGPVSSWYHVINLRATYDNVRNFTCEWLVVLVYIVQPVVELVKDVMHSNHCANVLILSPCW